MNKKKERVLTMMYSNIQGITKKRESLIDIMENIDCDVCLLAETMTCKVKIPGNKCVTSRKSVGQNVCIILRKQIMNEKIIRLYEPNEIANMLGIRVEIMNKGIRIYTAHMKQQSANTREEIQDQFEEMRNQFKSAGISGEGMILIFDANVHVGREVIKKCCSDSQDWGGKLLMSIIEEENLILMNSSDKCFGCHTRVDPRNGNVSSIDLVITNQFLQNDILEVNIDEKGLHKPANYTAKTKKLTDHNTIICKLKIEKICGSKQSPYVNTKCEDGRKNFCDFLNYHSQELDMFYSDPNVGLSSEFQKLEDLWNCAIDNSFEKISQKKNRKCGIDSDVRLLMKEERRIRDTYLNNPERGRLIFENRKRIHEKIAFNRGQVISKKIEDLKNSKNPQREVFKIRREKQNRDNLGFPLQDKNGVIQVSKVGIDSVVCDHFKSVFAQNPKPKGEIWEMYWEEVDQLFIQIDKRTTKESVFDKEKGPSLEETRKLLTSIDPKTSVMGNMTGDLLKLAGNSVVGAIHKCLMAFFMCEDIPVQMKVERIVILYKNSGQLSNLDNYRGIFLRHIIASLLQKWLYTKCAPGIDESGSEYAFGGRTERAVREVLLIVKLIQDHAKWTKQPLIMKFLDIRKFFDTMNYKTALIEAYKSGLKGKFWRIYKKINAQKLCVPQTPLGACGEIDVEEVFVQGSSDAMLMAWNLVDSYNKPAPGSLSLDPVFCVEGVEIPRLGFVDDLMELSRSVIETKVSCVADEVFENQHRIEWKPVKCKIIPMNVEIEPNDIQLNGEYLEILKEHVYLGTLVAQKNRVSDLRKRIKDAKGVINEVVEICKSEAIGTYRFRHMFTLFNPCFLQKFKHGCEVWDRLYIKDRDAINGLLPQAIKRVLELPRSTPTNAVRHDFGLIPIQNEIEIEVLLLTVQVSNMDDERIAKRLLLPMMMKKVPGFCTHSEEIAQKYNIDIEILRKEKDQRKFLKDRVIEHEKVNLLKELLCGSKTDRITLNYCYSGNMMKYLYDLPFPQGRIIFVFRCRMFPTRVNFPERWTSDLGCIFCTQLDTDEHLFNCWGYMDLCEGVNIDSNIFYTLDAGIEELCEYANVLLKIHERLELMQNDSDLS